MLLAVAGLFLCLRNRPRRTKDGPNTGSIGGVLVIRFAMTFVAGPGDKTQRAVTPVVPDTIEIWLIFPGGMLELLSLSPIRIPLGARPQRGSPRHWVHRSSAVCSFPLSSRLSRTSRFPVADGFPSLEPGPKQGEAQDVAVATICLILMFLIDFMSHFECQIDRGSDTGRELASVDSAGSGIAAAAKVPILGALRPVSSDRPVIG